MHRMKRNEEKSTSSSEHEEATGTHTHTQTGNKRKVKLGRSLSGGEGEEPKHSRSILESMQAIFVGGSQAGQGRKEGRMARWGGTRTALTCHDQEEECGRAW